jgi:hypothetical protein
MLRSFYPLNAPRLASIGGYNYKGTLFMNKITIFLFSVLIFSSCKPMNGDNNTILPDPEEQQKMQDREEVSKKLHRKYEKKQEKILRNYVEQKNKIDLLRQEKKKELERRMQEENERYQKKQSKLDEKLRAAKRTLDEVKKREYETQWSAIIELMKAHDRFLKEQKIPLNSRRKLITESTIDWLVDLNKTKEC